MDIQDAAWAEAKEDARANHAYQFARDAKSALDDDPRGTMSANERKDLVDIVRANNKRQHNIQRRVKLGAHVVVRHKYGGTQVPAETPASAAAGVAQPLLVGGTCSVSGQESGEASDSPSGSGF